MRSHDDILLQPLQQPGLSAHNNAETVARARGSPAASPFHHNMDEETADSQAILKRTDVELRYEDELNRGKTS